MPFAIPGRCPGLLTAQPSRLDSLAAQVITGEETKRLRVKETKRKRDKESKRGRKEERKRRREDLSLEGCTVRMPGATPASVVPLRFVS